MGEEERKEMTTIKSEAEIRLLPPHAVVRVTYHDEAGIEVHPKPSQFPRYLVYYPASPVAESKLSSDTLKVQQ
jgi:hypothetical protein